MPEPRWSASLWINFTESGPGQCATRSAMSGCWARRSRASRQRRCSGGIRRFTLELNVPEISRFLGIVVAMFYNDHPPPHFHVRYGKQRAIIGIESLVLLEGELSPRILGACSGVGG